MLVHQFGGVQEAFLKNDLNLLQMMLNKEMLDISLLMLKGTVERIDVKIISVRLNDLLFLQKKVCVCIKNVGICKVNNFVTMSAQSIKNLSNTVDDSTNSAYTKLVMLYHATNFRCS